MDLYFLFFDDFQTLDIFGPIDVLSRLSGAVPHYISLTGGPVRSAQGGIVQTEAAPKDLRGILVIPGGRGTRALVSDEAFLAALKDLCQNAEYVLAVCTGSALLAKAGLLDGRYATTNKKAFEWVRSCSDRVNWVPNEHYYADRWEEDGKFYTSAGVSAGIDMALGFVRRRYGMEEVCRIAADMEYIGANWAYCPDKLYELLMLIRKRPSIWVDNDIFRLKDFIHGFITASGPALRDWNCLTGFNEYCSSHFRDRSDYDWATFISERYPKEEAVSVFFELLDSFLKDRTAKGFPQDVPPPWFETGGIYRIRETSRCFAVLCFEYPFYLLAVFREYNPADPLIGDCCISWSSFGWIPPAEVEQIGKRELRGDYRAVNTVQWEGHDKPIKNTAADELFSMEGGQYVSKVSNLTWEELADSGRLIRRIASENKRQE